MNVNSTDHHKKPDNLASQVLLEDNHLLIVNKLPSQIVQGDKTGDQPLVDLLKEYIKVKYAKPGDVFLGVVHRLDRPVSGAVIFARTSKALTRLNNMLKNREIKKTYWAVVKNKPTESEGHLVHYLSRNEARNKTFVLKSGSDQGQKAELIYKTLAQSQQYYLLEVNLLTGRHHQIRAQLSAIGCPIKGDLKYGAARSNADGSIHLHARSIEFMHPVSREKVICIAQPPKDPVWDFFAGIGI